MDVVHTSENKAVVAGPKNLSSSASAQDLRMFEMEKEKHDDSYPRGIIDESIRNPENGSSSPKDIPSSSQIGSSKPRCSPTGISSSFSPLAVPRMSTRKRRNARENLAARISLSIHIFLEKIKPIWTEKCN